MFSDLTVARSLQARVLFLASAAITAAAMIAANQLGSARFAPHLSTIFLFLFTRYDYQGAACSLLILLAAVFVPHRLPWRRVLSSIGRHVNAVAVGCFALLCLGSLLVYRNHPLSMDEYAQFFQSRVFAAGHLTGRFPPSLMDWLVPEGFQNYFLNVSGSTGQVASNYLPSFALLLTPFTWAGIPWACNPLICGLTLIAVHRLATTLFDSVEAAGAALLLTISSPAFFANGISYYSMPAHLLANSVFALLLLRPTPRRMLIAGIVGSVALTLHNPFPHLLFAIPWVAWLAGRRHGARLMGCLLLGYLPLCLLLGLGWVEFCSGFAHSAAVLASGTRGISSGLERIGAAFDLPTRATLFARLIGITKLWLWSVPGLAILAGIGAWRWRACVASRLLLASALMTLFGYLFVPSDQGHGWGYRYFHSAWMALPVLAAGCFVRPAAIGPHADTSVVHRQTFEDGAVRSFVVACALLSLLLGVGFRALQIQGFIAADLGQVPSYQADGNRVVLLNPAAAGYERDLIQNDPWLRGDTITMESHGSSQNALMMRYYFPELRLVYEDPFGEVWMASRSDP